jgi:hypothetical protein
MVIASTFDIDGSPVDITSHALQVHVIRAIGLLTPVVVIALTLVVAVVRRFAVCK